MKKPLRKPGRVFPPDAGGPVPAATSEQATYAVLNETVEACGRWTSRT